MSVLRGELTELCTVEDRRLKVSKITFEALVRDHSTGVLNTALRILGDAQLAQDVHQEVFLSIWRRWHKYDGQVNFKAYLYRTTVRHAIKAAKRLRSQRSKQLQPDSSITNGSAEADLRTAELRRALAVALGKLPDRQADVFVLSRIEGLKSKKIAGILGCSEETVRVHLHRAMKRLSVMLSDYLER